MKMYKKSNLSLINGMLVSESGDIVMPDRRIVDQANKLETIIQQTFYLEDQPQAMPMPSLKGFKRESINDIENHFIATTPLLDDKIAEAMNLMDEIDDINIVNKANQMMADFGMLVDFVSNDYVIDCGGDMALQFDTPRMGDVLKLTKEDITVFIAHICGLCDEDLCDNCPADDKDDKDTPRHGVIAVPATKENLRKLEEFLDDITNDGDTKDDGSEE